MKRIFFLFLLMLFSVKLFCQQDSIFIQAKSTEDFGTIAVQQEIIYHNPLQKSVDKIKLLNWIEAYKNRKTPLLKRQLENRKKQMYFADQADLGHLQNLNIQIADAQIINMDTTRENLFLPLSKPINPGESVKIMLQYTLKIPSQKFTGYGKSDKEALLKYFFLVPDGYENQQQSEKNYLDIEENQTAAIYWKIILDLPANTYSKSNLPEKYVNYYEGLLKNDPEILISTVDFPRKILTISDQKVMVDFGFPLTSNEAENLEFYLPLQLKFIQSKTGILPEKIFISQKLKKEEDFVGNDDIRFWKLHYHMFSEAENNDLDYFGIVAKSVLNQQLSYDKNTQHWLINGIKTYLEKQYITTNYADRKLLGDLPEEVKILGLKPLKWFYASKLKLNERYGIAYQYIQTENFDQKISEDFSKLSNFNKTAISHFETGSLFDFIAGKTGTENFDYFIGKSLRKYEHEKLNTDEFLDELSVATNNDAAFLKTFIQNKQRINFNLKKYKKNGDSIALFITKNTTENIPLKIDLVDKNNQTTTFWKTTEKQAKTNQFNIPNNDAEKILINNQYIFPESNYRDNYLYTKGFFANAKKLKLKLFQDIPNPEYNEIYLNPRLSFNAYDKILLGINFRNTSLFRRKLAYSVTPYYSSGTGKLTGSAGASYTFMPPESFFRFLQIGVSGSYFHYDYGLSYKRFSTFAGINFTKNPRSDIGRSLNFSYNYFQKALTPEMIANNEYGKYNLWNLNYNYYDQRLIHETNIGGGLQWMEDFLKISGEAFFRYEYAKDKKWSARIFGGYFLMNTTQNNLFNFGVAKVSNYAFSYGLLGQSATSGLLSQQFVLADGGFKSFVAPSVNQWMGSVNTDINIWKLVYLYADAGLYKNKSQSPKFIWDSGIKLGIIPDFIEIYFPIQSSLGFEPSFTDYGKRIRFSLVLNLGAITNYLRRGKF